MKKDLLDQECVYDAHITGEYNMNHTHEYKYWHKHPHLHIYRDLPDGLLNEHDEGHYHRYAQTHNHGKGGEGFHAHQYRLKEIKDDELTKHHHAIADHKEEK